MKPLLIIWLLWPHVPGFEARWVTMPPSIDLDTYRAAIKAAARPSFCMWDYPGTACRLS
jgi:hypothetical protein